MALSDTIPILGETSGWHTKPQMWVQWDPPMNFPPCCHIWHRMSHRASPFPANETGWICTLIPFFQVPLDTICWTNSPGLGYTWHLLLSNDDPLRSLEVSNPWGYPPTNPSHWTILVTAGDLGSPSTLRKLHDSANHPLNHPIIPSQIKQLPPNCIWFEETAWLCWFSPFFAV